MTYPGSKPAESFSIQSWAVSKSVETVEFRALTYRSDQSG